MKNFKISFFILIFSLSSSFISAQIDKDSALLKEDANLINPQHFKIYNFSSEQNKSNLENLLLSKEQSDFFKVKEYPHTSMKITDLGLIDQMGTTYHIRIKEPDISNLAKMPTKNYE